MEMEENWRCLIDNVPDIIMVVDRNGTIQFINHTVPGITPEQAIGKSVYDYVPCEHHKTIRKSLEHVFQTGESDSYEIAGVGPHGTTSWYWTYVGPIKHQEQVVAASLITRDITARKKMEQQLRESEQRFRIIFDNAADGFLLADTETKKFHTCNKTICKMLGYDEEEIKNLGVNDIHPVESLPYVFEQFGKQTRGEQTLAKDIPVKRKNGSVFYADINSFPITLDGRIYLLGIFRDVTNRKEAEDSLRKSEEMVRAILNATTESVLMIDKQGTTLAINKTGAERFGKSPEEILGLNARDVMAMGLATPDVIKSRMEQVNNVFCSGKPVRFQDRRGEIILDSSIYPVFDDKGQVTHVAIFSRDVTEQAKAEKALRELKNRYQTLFECAPIGIRIATREGRILEYNDTMLKMTGYSDAELKQINLKDTYQEPRMRELLLKMLQTDGHVSDFEVQLRRKDGTAYFASLTVTPLVLHGQDVLLTVQEDITERKKAEEELRQSEELLKSIIDLLPIRIFWKDKNSVYLGCNKIFAKDAGVNSPDEVIGKDDFQFIWKEQAELYRSDDETVRKTGKAKLNYMEPSTTPQGDRIWLSTSKVPLTDVNGNIIGVLGAYEDITEHKKAEDALRESEQKYKGVVDNIGIGVSIISPNMEILFLNRQMQLWFPDIDASKKPICYKSFNNPPREGVCSYCPTYKTLKDGHVHEAVTETPAGNKIINYRIISSPIKDKDGKVIAAIEMVEDITAQKKAEKVEKELNEYREKMVRAEQLASLGTLSATLAHELTQPLTAIRLPIENSLAELQRSYLSETIINDLKDSLSEISHIVSIVDGLRNYARQSSEKKVSKVKLTVVAQRILTLLSENARRANVTFHLTGMDKLPSIYWHEKDLEQLFFVLIDNAIQASDGQKSHQLTITGSVKNGHIELQFSDDCGGIKPENLDKIFEPFFTTKPAGEGTGLGLCIVQRITSQAGGKVRVESKAGEGSTFFVTLPINIGKSP